jgi:hypothetical protein
VDGEVTVTSLMPGAPGEDEPVTAEEIEAHAQALVNLAQLVRSGLLTVKRGQVDGFTFNVTDAGRQYVQAMPR